MRSAAASCALAASTLLGERFQLKVHRGSVNSFTALEEQLGLKLEKTKAPTGFIVIDHVERPSPNDK
jgi:hypothetical protein